MNEYKFSAVPFHLEFENVFLILNTIPPSLTHSNSKIPVFSYLSPSTQFKSVSSDLKEILRHADKSYKVIGEEMPLPESTASSSSSDVPAATKPESNKKFFGFLNKQKDAKKDKKKKDKDKSNKNKKKKTVVNENISSAAAQLSNASDTSSAASKDRLYPPFVPSKRIIEHHEYQNIKEEAANERAADKAPVLRRFGDTNVLKNKKDFNNINHKLNAAANKLASSKHVTTFAEQSVDHRSSSGDNSFLSSLDATDCTSSYCASKFFNIELKSPGKSQFNYKYSAGSSASNLSSGSTISDSNSLDSMEHEIIHRKPTAIGSSGVGGGVASDSYLGPFNFRQLLRPTQGPTESLRKRRGINLSSTPPPLQKGKTKI